MSESNNITLTPNYIRNLRLNESKKYKILMINKQESSVNDNFEPAKEILSGTLISQHGYIFVFECTNKRNVKKRVCINKIDYIMNKKLIKEVK